MVYCKTFAVLPAVSRRFCC